MGPEPVDAVVGRAFFDRPVTEVALALLGCVLSSRSKAGLVAVRLTEVEAYGGAEDAGSHAFRGRTARNATMYGEPGHAYVYFTYGMHWCLNLVCQQAGDPAAVLLRAGEVVVGGTLAAERRPRSSVRDLARGPARMTRALGVDGACDGVDVTAAPAALQVAAGEPVAAARVRSGPRVGVAGAGAATPWRFWVDGEPTVSVYRPAAVRRRVGT
ncbi:MAG: DNA-3-methyladenine glycosylase [Actinomycetota bacterium]|nr:DNA-3-methyladenine glycosylase [Actinomycetota bacterium]